MPIILYMIVGLIAGIAGGALGLGGGAIMVPVFVLLFGLTQHQAQGTALAVMLPPIFIFAVLRYYWAGNVKVQMAIFVAVGFIVGAFLGAHFVQNIPGVHLKKVFGIFLVIIGIKMAFLK
ncbi:MAG: sulfite exporter TauE/SafE family protein [Candidatus Omnitrophica bacterium]|nr:sulfite exporter TauE/SafE family protein [Candidatus Omnitrophota bacterium]